MGAETGKQGCMPRDTLPLRLHLATAGQVGATSPEDHKTRCPWSRRPVQSLHSCRSHTTSMAQVWKRGLLAANTKFTFFRIQVKALARSMRTATISNRGKRISTQRCKVAKTQGVSLFNHGWTRMGTDSLAARRRKTQKKDRGMRTTRPRVEGGMGGARRPDHEGQ